MELGGTSVLELARIFGIRCLSVNRAKIHVVVTPLVILAVVVGGCGGILGSAVVMLMAVVDGCGGILGLAVKDAEVDACKIGGGWGGNVVGSGVAA